MALILGFLLVDLGVIRFIHHGVDILGFILVNLGLAYIRDSKDGTNKEQSIQETRFQN